MTKANPPDGWEAHRCEQLEGHLLATPAQRLRWLEKAILFAFRAGALPRPTEPTSPPGSRDEPSADQPTG